METQCQESSSTQHSLSYVAQNSQSECEPDGKKDDFKLYRRRHVVLLVLALSLFANGEVWMTFVSVTSQSMEYFSTTEQNVNWFGSIFLVAYAIEAIPCTFAPQLFGLKNTILVGCALNFAGIIFRLTGIVIGLKNVTSSFALCMVGNLLFGFAQGFSLNLPSMVSARWFGEKERSVSTAVGYMSNAIGVGVGFIDIFMLMRGRTTTKEYESAFMYMTIAEVVFIAVTMIIAVVFLRERPKTPPSKSEASLPPETTMTIATMMSTIKSMLKQMVELVKCGQSLALLFIFTTYYGNYTSLFIFLSSIADAFITNKSNLTGYMVAIGVIIGGVLTLLFGLLMERTKNKYNVRTGVFVQVLCAIPLIVILILILTKKLESAELLVPIVVFLGVCTPYISVGCELLADVTYPTDPNVSTNEALIFGNIFGALITYLLGLIEGNKKYYVSISLAVALYLINVVLLLSFKFNLKRMKVNDEEGG